MKNQIFSTFFFFAFLAYISFSCEKDTTANPNNESELITTVSMTFTPASGSAKTFKWADKDRVGSLAPVIDSIVLAANTSYTVSAEFSDESKSPVENLTADILKDRNDHLVCYTSSGFASAVQITDQDKKKNPLGLEGTFVTTTAGNGSLKVCLKHKPDKKATTPCSTGETDVEVIFPVVIK